MSDPVVLLSTGDVVGPAGGVTDNSMVLFSGTSGKLIKGNNAQVTVAGLALLDDVDAAAQRTTLGLKTGALADITTSPTDTTAGRVTKVGDFGLGGASPLVADADSLTTPAGFYCTDSTSTGLPVASTLGLLTVTRYANSNSVAQEWTVAGNATGSAGKKYIRTYDATGLVWKAWVEVATSANSLGQGQTWKNLTSSRATGVNYTNTTGRHILVIISGSRSTGRGWCVLDGVEINYCGTGATASGWGSATFIVPHGSVYQAATGSVSTWLELR